MPCTFRTPMVSRPSPSMASRPLTARLIRAVSNWAMSAIAKQLLSRYLDVDPDPAADEGTDELGHGLDLRADIEHLRLQRLPAGKCQQLTGQLGSALHGLGNRVDVAPAALFRQFAAAQEVGRGADDGQEIVEIVRHAAGQLPDRFHLLRLAQRFLALAALRDVDGVRHRADDRAVLIAQRAHREVEIALADRQAQQHLGLDFLAPHHGDEGVADGVAHAFGAGKPRRVPERLADHRAGLGADSGQRRLVGIQEIAVLVRAAPDTDGWSPGSRASGLRWIPVARFAR